MAETQQFFIDKVYDRVSDELVALDQRTDEYQTLFEQRTAELATAQLPQFSAMPVFTDPSNITSIIPALPTRPTRPTGDFTGFNPPTEPADTLTNVVSEIDQIIAAIPVFTPSITGLTIPSMPAPIDTSGAPSRPELEPVVYPVAPALTEPSLDNLQPIVVPTFVFPTLPTFDATAPEFTASTPAAVIAWAEPDYASELFDEVRAKVSDMLAGQSGLPAAVEQALFDRARSRDDIAALRATQDAFDAFAAKGYSMPPGVLVKQVNAVIEDSQLKANATGREIYIKAQETLIQQLNAAVQQGVAMEQLTINLFNNTMNRRLEIEKFRLEQALSIYNAEVQAFNIRSQAYGVQASVFKTLTDAALARLDAYRTEVEAQKLVSEINQQAVETYKARLEAVRTRVDTYRVAMEAAKVQTDVQQSQIAAYRADIEAWATRIQADKTRFDAYETAVKGEQSKAGILEAEARAFASRVQATETAGTLSIRKIQAKIEAAQQATQRYVARVQSERDRVAAQADQFRSVVSAYSADIQAYATEYQNNVALRELDVKKIEASLRNAIARYEAEIRKYDGEAERLIKVAELNRDSLKALSQYAAQLAAGAMSARNLGMNVSGQGQGSDSFNVNQNYNFG